MFLTLTPNPCLEKTLHVPDFLAGGSFRISPDNALENVGGKGINAARVAARFGLRSVAIAPLGPNLRNHLEQLAAPEAFELHAVGVAAPTRICHNVVSQSGSTELLEAGHELSIGDGVYVFEAWRQLLPQCDLALIGGSYPPAKHPAWVHHGSIMCAMAQTAGKKLIYDGKGEAFQTRRFPQKRRLGRSNRISTKRESYSDCRSKHLKKNARLFVNFVVAEWNWFFCHAARAVAGWDGKTKSNGWPRPSSKRFLQSVRATVCAEHSPRNIWKPPTSGKARYGVSQREAPTPRA